MGKITVIRHLATVAPQRGDTGPKRVGAYCRVSKPQEEQGESFETQCAYYARLISSNPGMTLVAVYGDRGASGLSTVKRPEFQRMMRDCMEGEIDVVMTKSVSRFARNLADCVNCVRKLKEKGIPVLFEKENLNSMNQDGEFLLSILATLAQEEVNNLSQNILWSFEHRNAAGDPTRMARYGYRRSTDEAGLRIWRVYEPEAKRVRLAFQMAEKGESYLRIISALDGVESEEGNEVRWTRPRVYRMLKSEVYMGDILTNKGFKPDYLSSRFMKNTGQRAQYYLQEHHEPIVDRATFARVGELISRNALWTRRSERSASI